jgi:methionyl-tRNA formyltransferase
MEFDDATTLRESYDALAAGVQELFRENWPALRDGSLLAQPQSGAGSAHRAREFLAVKDRLLGAEGWDLPIGLLKERWQALRAHGA